MKSSYETPILVNVCRAYAVLSVVAGIVGAAMSLSDNLPIAVLCIAGGIGQAVICFGLAQCVDYLGRTAYNTGVVAEHAEREQHKTLQAARNVGGGYGSRTAVE